MRRRLLELVLLAALCALSACGGGSSGGEPPPPPPPPPSTLKITTDSNIKAVDNLPFSLALQATGAVGATSWSVKSGSLPSGVTLDPNTGSISGAPTSGGSVVTIQVKDTKATASKAFDFVVYSQTQITPVVPPNANLSVPYSLQLSATGNVIASWTISAGQLPPGLTLAPNPGNAFWAALTGTPTSSGTFSFTIQVQDYTLPQIATLDLTLMVDTHLAIAKWNLQDGGQNQSYSDAFVAVNGKPPFRWSVSGLPAGLSLNAATGQVTGTPTSYGVISYSVSVVDSASPQQSDTQNGAINLVGQLQLIGAIPDAIAGVSYYYSLIVLGGRAPYTFSITSGALPPGIILNSNYGYLQGVASILGTYNFVIQVQDSSPQPYVITQSETMHVNPVPLVFGGSPIGTAPLGVVYHSQLPLQGGMTPYRFAILSGQLPPGITLDTTTGDLDGTPTQLGTFNFAAQGTDSGSPPQTASTNFYIVVTTPLGRNDTIQKATPLGNGSWTASISPYIDPISSTIPNPDTDYYKIIAKAGSIVHVETFAARIWGANPLDTVIEIVDVNGIRLLTCTAPSYVSACLNDDISSATRDSALDIRVGGGPGSQTNLYVHVLDWRGDARPDMLYTLSLTGVIDPLTISPATLGAGATRGVSYSQQLTTSGGTGVVSWAVSAGALPPGWILSSSGLLSGIATTNGAYSFTVQATDSASPPQTAHVTYSLAIADPVKITSPSSWPDACLNQPYSFTIQTAGGVAPIRYSFYSSQWIGINLDQNTGTFSGMSQVLGTFTGTVGANDSAQPSSGASQIVTLKVVNCG